jgi:hypothetical protein
MHHCALYTIKFPMEKVWQLIATAPANAELELSIYDKGEYHALGFPCQRDGLGWRDVRAGRSVMLEPTHWRVWAAPCGGPAVAAQP